MITQEELDYLKSIYSKALPPEGSHWEAFTPDMDKITLDQLKVFRKGFSGNFDNGHREVSKQAWELLDTLSPEAQEVAVEDEFGSPKLTYRDGKPYSYASIEYAYFAQEISSWLPDWGTVVEIGGGYGGLMKALVRLRPDVDFDIYDLGPMALMQAIYLGETLEDDLIRFYIHPWQDLEHYPDNNTDMVVASRSLFEVPLERANWYMKHIRRILVPGGYFYSVARRKISDPDEWDTTGLKLLSSEPFVLNPKLTVRIYQRGDSL